MDQVLNKKRFIALALLVAAVTVLAFFYYTYRDLLSGAVFRAVAVESESPAKTDEFGFEPEKYNIEDRSIRRNETFADILTGYDVPYQDVIQLVDLARPVFNIRHLRAGNPIRIYRDDSLHTPHYVVYERDRVNYIVFGLQDSMRVFEGQRDITDVRKTAHGIINGSLWITLQEQGVNPELATELSEVLAWQVDFYRIQKGDRFSVIFEERMIDDESAGIAGINAVRFDHANRTFYGFFFDPGEGGDYFDEEGNSLRKAFLKAPLKFKRISSRYTLRRYHPVTKQWRAHLGTDYAAAPGTPIHTVGDGVIVEARYAQYNGNYVKVRHNGTYTTGYLHMQKIASGIRPGVAVKQGDVIGYVGSTGLANGPHLCFRFYKNGQQVDPFREEIPSVEPLDSSYFDIYHTVMNPLMEELDLMTEPQIAQDASNGTLDEM